MNISSSDFRPNRQAAASSIIALVIFPAILLTGLGSSLMAEEESSQLNTILDIDALYTPLQSQAIHGLTAINLLSEL